MGDGVLGADTTHGNHRHACVDRGADARQRIFKYDAIGRVNTQHFGSQQDDRTVNAMVDLVEPGTISLISVLDQDLGYVFRDEMTIHLTRDSFDAFYTADSTFIMDFNNTDIGSAQTAAGRISITTCTADMELVPDTFAMTATDNQGNETNSTEFADGTMFEEMQKNYTAIMTAFPQMLAEAGLTPADIGFENLT